MANFIGKTADRSVSFKTKMQSATIAIFTAIVFSVFAVFATSEAAFALDDGIYKIASQKDSSYVLDQSNAMANNGTNTQLCIGNDTLAQQWYIQKIGGTTNEYRIISMCDISVSTQALEAAGGGTDNGTNVATWSWNESEAQRWYLDQNANGTYTIRNKKSNRVLDISGGTMVTGTNIQLYDSNGTPAQQWNLIALDAETTPQPTNKGYSALKVDNTLQPSNVHPVVETGTNVPYDVGSFSEFAWTTGGSGIRFAVNDINNKMVVRWDQVGTYNGQPVGCRLTLTRPVMTYYGNNRGGEYDPNWPTHYVAISDRFSLKEIGYEHYLAWVESVHAKFEFFYTSDSSRTPINIDYANITCTGMDEDGGGQEYAMPMESGGWNGDVNVRRDDATIFKAMANSYDPNGLVYKPAWYGYSSSGGEGTLRNTVSFGYSGQSMEIMYSDNAGWIGYWFDFNPIYKPYIDCPFQIGKKVNGVAPDRNFTFTATAVDANSRPSDAPSFTSATLNYPSGSTTHTYTQTGTDATTNGKLETYYEPGVYKYKMVESPVSGYLPNTQTFYLKITVTATDGVLSATSQWYSDSNFSTAISTPTFNNTKINPAITLTKTVDRSSIMNPVVGDLLTYSFTIKNTGNVDLTNLMFADELVSNNVTINWPSSSRVLAVGAQVPATATYSLVSGDLSKTQIVNVATVTGTYSDNGTNKTITSNQARAVTTLSASQPAAVDYHYVGSTPPNMNPSNLSTYHYDGSIGDNYTVKPAATTTSVGWSFSGWYLDQSCTTPAGSTIQLNQPQTDLYGKWVHATAKVDYHYVGAVPSSVATPSSLGDYHYDGYIGDSYTVKPGAVATDNKWVFDGWYTNEACTTPATSPITLTTPQTDLYGKWTHSEIQLTKTVSPTSIANATPGSTVTYTFTIKNTGSNALSQITLTDNKIGSNFTQAPATSLAVGATTTATATYALTQADITAGRVDNTANVSGKNAIGGTVTDEDDATVTVTGTSSIKLVKTVSPSSFTDPHVGDEAVYTFTITNTGSMELTNVKVTDPVLGGTITPLQTTLAPGASTTAIKRYALTQTDIDAGVKDNTATATGRDALGREPTDTSSARITITRTPAIKLVKTTPNENLGTVPAGTSVPYTFTITNTGNVTLHDITLTDNLDGMTLNKTNMQTTLAPGASTTATGTYALKQTDIESGQVNNTATATGKSPNDQTVRSTDTATVNIDRAPAIKLEKTTPNTNLGAISAGTSVPYTFKITNTGNVTLSSITLTDDLNGMTLNTSNMATTLAPGASTTATGTYSLKQADINAGKVKNTATTTGKSPNGQTVQDTDDVTVNITRNPAIKLEKTTPNENLGAVNAGTSVPYTFKITNVGNVTLTNVTLTDNLNGMTLNTSNMATTLAPNVSTTATGTYSLKQADIDAGKVENTATTTGKSPDGQIVQDTDKVTVNITRTPAIKLEKTTPNENLGVVNAGTSVPYTFKITNTGNVTLHDITLADNLNGMTLNTSNMQTTLAPGASTTATGTYALKQADIEAGQVNNTATSTGKSPNDQTVRSTDTATVNITRAPAIKLEKTTPNTNLGAVNAGTSVPYTFKITNTGNVALSSITLTDNLSGMTLDKTNMATTLAPGASTTATGTYALKQADIDAGKVDNTATATGKSSEGQTVQDTDDVTVNIAQDPVIKLEKTTPNENLGAVNAGTSVPYTFKITNTGNVTLSSITLTDNLNGMTLNTSGMATTLAPGASTTATGTYSLKQADIDVGKVKNSATTTGKSPNGQTVQDTDDVTVNITQNPAIKLEKTTPNESLGAVNAGTSVPYTFKITNVGNVTLTNVTLTDNLNGMTLNTSNMAASLAPNVSTTATGTYSLKQADIDAGKVENTATTTGKSPSGQIVQDTDKVTVNIQQAPSIKLEKTTPNENLGAVPAGVSVPYTFKITNTGNVTLHDITLTDNLAGMTLNKTNMQTTLAPNASTTATGQYALKQNDIDEGKVTNNATATGKSPADKTVQDTDTVTVNITRNPAIKLEKTTPTDVIENAHAGTSVPYTFKITNIGNVTLSNITLEDNLPGMTLDKSGMSTTLAPGAYTTASGTYALKQTDIDAGKVDNTATATGKGTDGQTVRDTDNVTVNILQDPKIKLVKSANRTQIENAHAGDLVTYTFTVTNTGNVTLTNVKVEDPAITSSTITLGKTTLAPNESTTGTAQYAMTQADVDAQVKNNTATATGNPPSGPPVTSTSTWTIQMPMNPKIDLVKEIDGPNTIEKSTPGTIVHYKLTITNTGNVTLHDLVLTDELSGISIDTSQLPATLAPNEKAYATATYSLTQADINAGEVLNHANVTALPPSGTDRVRDDDRQNLDLPPDPKIDLDKAVDKPVVEAGKAGDVVTYTLTITNTGNVTLANVKLEDPMLGGDIELEKTVLDPGETTAVEKEYVLTQDDVDAGEVNNTAITTANPPSGPPVTDTATANVKINFTSVITLDKSVSYKPTAEDGASHVGDIAVYTFVVGNAGTCTLGNIILEDERLGGNIDLSSAVFERVGDEPPADLNTALRPGDTFTVSVEYKLTQEDIDSEMIENEAIVTGDNPAKEKVTDKGKAEFPPIQAPAISLVKEAAVSEINGAKLGDVINYTLTITNTGNVTLSNLSLIDALDGVAIDTSTLPETLAPGEETVAKATYALTANDLNAGQVFNTATVKGFSPLGQEVQSSDDAVVMIHIDTVAATMINPTGDGIMPIVWLLFSCLSGAATVSFLRRTRH